VALPAAIERQEAEAEAIRRAAYDVVEEAPTSAPVVETPAPPQPPVPQPAPPAQPAPAQWPQQAAPVQAVPQPPVGTEDAAYWKQRFDTLAGKFDAEVPRLHQQLREQHERMQELSAQLEQRTAPPAADSPAMAQQVEQVQGYVAKSETDTFWKQVINLVPDWLAVDASPAWIQWLDTSPEYTEATYRQLAAQAIEKGRPEKVAKLVDEWRRATGQTTAHPGNGAQPPAPVQSQPNLSSQVAPSTVKSGSAPVSRRVLTRTDYEAMYDVRNVQRYGQQEAARLIAEADAAVAEGRVQW
jgi:hypothetical protein